MKTVTTLEKMAERFAEKYDVPAERLCFLAELRENFCFHCGRDHPARGECQCSNDE